MVPTSEGRLGTSGTTSGSPRSRPRRGGSGPLPALSFLGLQAHRGGGQEGRGPGILRPPDVPEDEDNDGLGDNLGIAGIAIHRVESDWVDFDYFFGLQETAAHHLWDFDSTGGTKLLIQGGSPGDPRGAIHLLSSTDLGQLDALDHQSNQSIRIDETASGSQSWEFHGPRSPDLLYENLGAVTDIDGDSIGDLVITSPFEEFDRGAVFIVHGSQLAGADAIDGSVDGKVNHTQCSFVGTCVAIFNSSNSYFGWSTTSLNGLFGEDTTVLAVTSYFSSERPE